MEASVIFTYGSKNPASVCSGVVCNTVSVLSNKEKGDDLASEPELYHVEAQAENEKNRVVDEPVLEFCKFLSIMSACFRCIGTANTDNTRFYHVKNTCNSGCG